MPTRNLIPAPRTTSHEVADAPPALQVAYERQIWFGPEDRSLFGWLAVPAGGVARGAVVLCSPTGEEGRASHRTFRRLAMALAEHGLLALRFDYDGTGDSAGGQFDAHRVESWLGSIATARRVLGDILGADAPVSAVGMRLGATLAARSAVDSPFHHLVLWDPCASGRQFLREGEALYAFGEDADKPDDGLRHTPGFQYDAETAAELRYLTFGSLPREAPLAERTLLLLRGDRAPGPGLLDRLEAEGARLELGTAHGQANLLDISPSDCEVPEQSLADVVASLSRAHLDIEDRAVGALPSADRVRVGDVVERAVTLGARPQHPGLFAVLTEPASAGRASPWIVMVNVATEHHIGPGRRWVEFARRWAAQGYRCVRIDQTAVGDSATPAGHRDDLGFSPAWIDDLPAALDDLDDGAPIVVIGLCSGAYAGLEAALSRHIDGVFAINPRLTLYPAAKGTPAYTPRRRAAFVPNRPIARLAHKRRILAGALWRIYRQVAVWHAPYVAIGRVARTGTRIEVVANHDDAQHFTEVAFWRPALRWRLARKPLAFSDDPAIDHSLLTLHAQEATWEQATRFITRWFPAQDA